MRIVKPEQIRLHLNNYFKFKALAEKSDEIGSLIEVKITTSRHTSSVDTIQSLSSIRNKPSSYCKFSPAKIIAHLTSKRLPLVNLKITRNNIPAIWAFSSFILFVTFAISLVAIPWKTPPPIQGKYSIYLSSPLVLKNMDYEIYSKDSRAQRVNAVFKEYRCPLEGLGEVFVYEADKFNIPWWLTAAMSFQESSCGKMTPEPNGMESYNAWGWAVYGDNVQSFDNWVRGVETVSEYMSERFYSKGITDLCEIMKTYTPPSNGSWCRGVEHYGQEILDFQSEPAGL